MSKKKSYMNQATLIAEGFFSKLFKKIKDKKFQKTVKKDKEFNKHLKDLNKGTETLENHLNKMLKDAGLKPNVKLDTYTLKDFL
jgi:hypothetical protein